jgi:hypothetical protein
MNILLPELYRIFVVTVIASLGAVYRDEAISLGGKLRIFDHFYGAGIFAFSSSSASQLCFFAHLALIIPTKNIPNTACS